VKLVKQWSDWGPGEIVTLESEKAKRVIAKGYGVEAKNPGRPRKAAKRPVVETATVAPKGETADARPSLGVK